MCQYRSPLICCVFCIHMVVVTVMVLSSWFSLGEWTTTDDPSQLSQLITFVNFSIFRLLAVSLSATHFRWYFCTGSVWLILTVAAIARKRAGCAVVSWSSDCRLPSRACKNQATFQIQRCFDNSNGTTTDRKPQADYSWWH